LSERFDQLLCVRGNYLQVQERHVQLLQLFLKLLVRRFDESISCAEQRIRTFFYAIKIRDRIL